MDLPYFECQIRLQVHTLYKLTTTLEGSFQFSFLFFSLLSFCIIALRIASRFVILHRNSPFYNQFSSFCNSLLSSSLCTNSENTTTQSLRSSRRRRNRIRITVKRKRRKGLTNHGSSEFRFICTLSSLCIAVIGNINQTQRI